MVVWVFAGGGHSEVNGLVPFLSKHFNCDFERKTPLRRKSGPKPRPGYGPTGPSLERQIKEQLSAALARGEKSDLILIVDDLDCHVADEQETRFLAAIDSLPGTTALKRLVGFAAPELEAWIVADWDNTIARHVDFRQHQQAMKWWLSHDKQVPFDAPESFSVYVEERGTCADKLSDAIIEAAFKKGETRYSKARHTPLFLEQCDPQRVSAKCPLFRKLYVSLSRYCQ
jgi:hypothetical protein